MKSPQLIPGLKGKPPRRQDREGFLVACPAAIVTSLLMVLFAIPWRSWRLGGSVLARCLAQSFLNEKVNQIRHANGVAPLVVIPRDHLCQVATDGQCVEGAEDG